jgi:hypothetical protein
MTLGQLVSYDHSELPDISFSLRIVAGIDNASVTNYYSGSSRVINENISMATLVQELYQCVLPQDSTYSTGAPPPKSVLSVGSMFCSAGVFDSIDPEYFGPYDQYGNPQEVEIQFNFIPTQFYDPSASGNRVGLNLKQPDGVLNVDQNSYNNSSQTQKSEIDTLLLQSPAGNSIMSGSHIIYLGTRGNL